MDKLQVAQAELFVKYLREDMMDITDKFVTIGFRLNEANVNEYYKILGYNSLEELAEEMFGIGRSTTFGMIAVWRRFHDTDNPMHIDARFKGYEYSKLLEMQKFRYLPSDITKRIQPTDSVRDIKRYVKAYNLMHQTGERLPVSLQEWKLKEEENRSESVQTFGQEEEIVYDSPVIEKEEDEPESVQTFGQKEEELEHTFEFRTRDDIRAFIGQYGRWNKQRTEFPKIDERDEMVCEHVFRNGDRVLIYQNRSLPESIDNSWGFQTHYFFQKKYAFGLYEVTKEVLEKYLMEHRKEL